MTAPIDAHDTDAKLSLQQRQQLSALVDGDLAPDQAGFLLRRLGHDAELAGRWQRWQLIGDVLRGQPVAALAGGADGFPAQVAAAVSREAPRQPVSRRPRWQHVAALAASVAVVALFLARPPSGDGGPTGAAPDAIAAIEAPPAAPAVPAPASRSVQPPPVETVREVSVPQFAEVARAAAPVPVRQRSVASASPRDEPAMPGPPGPAAAVDAVDAIDPAPSAALAASATSPVDLVPSEVRPFARPGEPQARPWPRATLPGLARPAGEFTVGFDDGSQPFDGATLDGSATPTFYPFEPQLPAGQADPEAGASAIDPERTP